MSDIVGMERLASNLASETGMELAVVRKIIRATFDEISAQLMSGKCVTVQNFGSWRVFEREPVEISHVRTGETQYTRANRFLRFRAASKLRRRINRNTR